jgi:hypothetical protein
MSVFGNILNKIFRRGGDSAPSAAGDPVPAQAPSVSDSDPSGTQAAAGGVSTENTSAGQAVAAAPQPVDVEAVLNDLASKNPQKLNWRTSIVDLMKLLDLDSGLGARKELATELGYTGAKDGSAEMNMWLHRQVMNKLAANGGKVPADLKD